jgi:multiple sugar transport system ATP-binding protein
MAEVRLSNLSKRFDDIAVVNRINLTVKDKEFLVLVGPSGCGKTTTLRMVAGLEDMDEGDIYIGDRLVNDVAPKDRDIAMVFQNYALYPHMNVYQNMAFGLKFRKLAKTEIDNRVRRAAEILGIEDLMFKKPRQLSGGQRQRVAMGRAIVRQPQVFLFDEPLSNLDAKLRVQMRSELSKLHEKLETTIIYVTHDQIEAMTLADRIVVMKDGHIMQIGTPLEVYENPQNIFVAGFIGSPPMNFIDAILLEAGGRLYIDGGNFSLPAPRAPADIPRARLNQQVVFGIRPDHIDDAEFVVPARGFTELDAIVEIIEPIGSEVILIASTGKHQFTAKVHSQTKARLHESIKLSIDMNKMHLFDKETGRKIEAKQQS